MEENTKDIYYKRRGERLTLEKCSKERGWTTEMTEWRVKKKACEMQNKKVLQSQLQEIQEDKPGESKKRDGEGEGKWKQNPHDSEDQLLDIRVRAWTVQRQEWIISGSIQPGRRCLQKPRHSRGRASQSLSTNTKKTDFQADRCSEVEDFCKAFLVAEFIAITMTHGFIVIFHVKGGKKRKKKQLSKNLPFTGQVKYKNIPKQMTAF